MKKINCVKQQDGLMSLLAVLGCKNLAETERRDETKDDFLLQWVCEAPWRSYSAP